MNVHNTLNTINNYIIVTVTIYLSYNRLIDGPDQYTGVISGDIVITYQMIQQDVHNAVHWAHTEVNIK